MNLSEIRKKAQQEKEAKTGLSAPAAGPEEESGEDHAVMPLETLPATPVETAPDAPVETSSEVPVGTAPEAPLDRLPAESRPTHPQLPPVLPEETAVRHFDPLAAILAGRAAARGFHGEHTAVPSAETAGDDFQELLCFRVAGEKYAVDIMEIREIIKPREVTEVPRMPSYVSGVLSLRGIIIPVFDMHKRLGHAVPEGPGKERIIVVKKDEEFFGVIVDEVIQVVRISREGIEPPPAVLDGIDRDFVGGIGRFDGQMLILLNLEKVLDLSLC